MCSTDISPLLLWQAYWYCHCPCLVYLAMSGEKKTVSRQTCLYSAHSFQLLFPSVSWVIWYSNCDMGVSTGAGLSMTWWSLHSLFVVFCDYFPILKREASSWRCGSWTRSKEKVAQGHETVSCIDTSLGSGTRLEGLPEQDWHFSYVCREGKTNESTL